jgi:hypothetical protein
MLLAALLLPVLISGPTLDDKIKSVLPKPEEEKWLTIPWRTSLMAARAEAQKLGKPMFLWIMNGHPLGCT